MLSGVFTKSTTIGADFPGYILFRRESVCTVAISVRTLSTYMAMSRGSSKPVWNLLATMRTFASSSSRKARATSLRSFIPISVTSSPASFRMVPEKATKVSSPWYPRSAMYAFIFSDHSTASLRPAVTTMAARTRPGTRV